MNFHSIRTLDDGNNLVERIIVKEQATLTPIRIVGRDHLTDFRLTTPGLIDQLFIGRQVIGRPLHVMEAHTDRSLLQRRINPIRIVITHQIESCAQDLNVNSLRTDDKGTILVFLNLKITLTGQIHLADGA